MPVISTSVSGSGPALDITTEGNYFISAPTYLESTANIAISIQPSAGKLSFTVAGTVLSGLGILNYYSIFDYGNSNELTLNVLATGYLGGGGILSSGRLVKVTNAGTLSGVDTGITAGAFADQIINTGIICAGQYGALNLAGGNDRVTNAGQIIGNIDLGSGNDILYGGGGSIIGSILLGEGNDVIDLRHAQVSGDITGGFGNDIFIVDSDVFNVFEAVSQGTDLVKSTISFELGMNFENLQLLSAADLNGTGNTLANTITGNAGDNRLDGGAGSDKLFGGAGDDRIIGDSGNDTISAGSGNDLLFGGAGNDVMVGETGADSIYGGAGRDIMTGDVGASGSYDDVFVFTKVSDSLNNDLSDRITDFEIGDDHINLAVIDAKSATVANEAFSFISTAFTNVAGQVRLQTSGSDTFVLGDLTGDGVADFRIILTGNLALTAADFIL